MAADPTPPSPEPARALRRRSTDATGDGSSGGARASVEEHRLLPTRELLKRVDRLERRLGRERRARYEAEIIAEDRLREIYLAKDRAEEAAARAEQASAAKTEFLANMSHELRTPMNGVIGVTSMLQETELDAEQQDYARLIDSSSRSLLAILNAILDFSKVEAGKVELDPQPFDLRALVADAVALVAAATREKGLDLGLSVSDSVPDRLVGDDLRIRQVIANLLSNATKFTEAGEVTVGVASRPTEGDRHELTLTVADTGIGIPDDRIDALFVEFEQADNSTTRRYGGTGLGLTITKQLVELMGGRIDVTSEVGVGTTFAVTIELAEATVAEEPDSEPAAVEPLHRPSMRVLVVEDNLVNQKVAVALLARLGQDPDVVGDGLAAVEAARAAPYDLVLMDVQLPGLDGLDASRLIRADPELDPQPRIVGLTAGVHEEDRARCLGAGMDDVLGKPVRIGELAAVLDAISGA